MKSIVTYKSDACLLWSNLKESFSVGNTVRVLLIKAQLSSCGQEGQSVLEYFGKLSTLWEELQVYHLVHVCFCGAAVTMAKEREQEKIHQFIMGLDARFGSLCTSIVGMDPLHSLGEINSKIVREEHRISSARSLQQDVISFVARRDMHRAPATRREQQLESAGNIYGRQDNSILRPRLIFSHCGRTCHEKRDCWQIVGFPEWFHEHSSGRGHSNGGRGRGGRASAGRGRGQASTAHATSSNFSSFPKLTSEQWKVLTQMIEEKSGTNLLDKLSGKRKLGDVILDTCASHHMA